MRRNQRLQNFTKPTDPLDLSNLNKSLADEYQDDQDPGLVCYRFFVKNNATHNARGIIKK